MAKSARSLQEINNDYFQTAAILGDLIWKVSKFTGEDLGTGQIGDLKRKLRTIDNEMDQFQLAKQKEDAANQELSKKRKEVSEKTNGAPGLTNIQAPVEQAAQA